MSLTVPIVFTEEQLDAIAAKVASRLGDAPAARAKPYTVKEAAAAIGCGKSDLYERVKAGLVARVPVVGTILIPAAEVRRIVEGRDRI